MPKEFVKMAVVWTLSTINHFQKIPMFLAWAFSFGMLAMFSVVLLDQAGILTEIFKLFSLPADFSIHIDERDALISGKSVTNGFFFLELLLSLLVAIYYFITKKKRTAWSLKKKLLVSSTCLVILYFIIFIFYLFLKNAEAIFSIIWIGFVVNFVLSVFSLTFDHILDRSNAAIQKLFDDLRVVD